VPHETFICPEVVKGESVFDGNGFHRVAKVVGGVSLEPAMFYVDDFIEGSRAVKSQYVL
jgi:hypothetical protein